MGKRWRKFWERTKEVAETAAILIAPTAYVKRKTARTLLRLQERMIRNRYNEAADNDRFRGGKWLGSRLSPDSALEEDLDSVRQRSKELARNDPLLSGYVKTKVTTVVGTGFHPQAQIKADPARGIDEERAKELNRQIEELFWRWYPKAHRDGRKSLWLIQRMIQRCYDRDGEALVVFSDKPAPGKPIPLCLEVIAVERLETPDNAAGNVRLGIERDADGAPVAYWIRKTHPDDTLDVSMEYDRVPAARVCHVYEEDDCDQSRGYPACRSTIALAKDLKDYDEATIIAEQVRACFAVFIKGSQNPYEQAVAATSRTDAAGKRIQEVSPGSVHYLGQGEEPVFATPGQMGPGHADYLTGQHHRMSAGLNWPYESLLKRYGDTNYSSGRLSLLDGRAVAECDGQLIVELFLERAWERIVEEAVIAGLVDVTPAEFLAAPWVFTAHVWIPNGWPWVDPLKEVQADDMAVSRGFASRTMVNRQRGLDDEDIQEQRLREKMRDADNEKKLRDYRKGLGLDAEEKTTPPANGNGRPQPPGRDGNGREDEQEDLSLKRTGSWR